MPTARAFIAAAIAGFLVFAVGVAWLSLSVGTAVVAGVVWALLSLLVTRVVYDDADRELAAWTAAAPDLAGIGTRVPDLHQAELASSGVETDPTERPPSRDPAGP